VVLESYDDSHYGYLRIVVTQAQLRIEYHATTDGTVAKSSGDHVTVDLATRQIAHFAASDLGRTALAAEARVRFEKTG
jgi:hypothetical protein